MFVAIANKPRAYAWGSDTAIAELLGTTSTGGPEAELWLGSHPGSPARVLDPAQVGGAHDLAEWIAAAPSEALGTHPRLPFLLKVLAAQTPLSLQAHPSAEQAQDGFTRENALGVRLDAPQRNYRDPYPKPEIIYALSDRFEALCGFRPVAETVALVRSLGLDDLAERLETSSLADVFEWLVTRGEGVAELVDAAVARAAASGMPKTKENDPEAATSGTEPVEYRGNSVDSDAAAALDTVRMLAEQYPGDPGIVVSLLLNRVSLRRGEALYLPAGNIHAYLKGLGIELMTASDNVLRGGLTPKHVDVDELLRVLDFTPTTVPYLRPESSGRAEVYRPEGPGFALLHLTGQATAELSGPAIALCTAGSFTVTGAQTGVRMSRGDAFYVTPGESRLEFEGDGEAFLATVA